MTDDVGRTRHGIKSLHNFLCRERTTNGVVGDFENLLKPLIHMDKRLTLRCHLIKARTTWYDGVPSPMQAETYDLKETIDLMKWRRQVSIEIYCKLVIDGIGDTFTNQYELTKLLYDK